MNLAYDHITREIERVRHRRRLLAAEDDFLPSTRTGFRQLQEKLAIDAAASRERNSQLLQQLRQLSELDSSRRTTAADVQLYALRGSYLALVHESFPQWYKTASKHIQAQVPLHQQQHMFPADPKSFTMQQQPLSSNITSNHQSYQQQQVPSPACTQAEPSNAKAATGHSNSGNSSHGRYRTSALDVHTRQVASAAEASDPGLVSAQDTAVEAGGAGAMPPAALEQLANSMAEQLVLLQQLVRQQHYPQRQQHHHHPEQQEQLAGSVQPSSKPPAAPFQQHIRPVDTRQHGQEQGGVVDDHQQRLLRGNSQEQLQQPQQQQQQQQSERDRLRLHRQHSVLMQQQQQVVAQQPAQQHHGWPSEIPMERQAVHKLAQQLPREPDPINKQQQEQEQQQHQSVTQQSPLPHRQEFGANTAQQDTHNRTKQQEVGEQYSTVYQQKDHPAQQQQQRQLEQPDEHQGQSQMSLMSHMSADPADSQQWQTGKQAISQGSAANHSATAVQQLDTLKAGPLVPLQQVAAGSNTAAVIKGRSHSSSADKVSQQHDGSGDVLAASQQAPVAAEPAQQHPRAASQPAAGSARTAAAAVSDPTQATEQQQTMHGSLRTRLNSLQQQQMPEAVAASNSTDANRQRGSNSGMHPAAAEQLLSLVDNMLAQQGSHMSDDESSEAPSVASLAESTVDDNSMLAISDFPAESSTNTLGQQDIAGGGQGMLADRGQQVLLAGFHRTGREGLNPAASAAADAVAAVTLCSRQGLLINSSAGTGTAAASGRQLTGKQDSTTRQSQVEYTTTATPAAAGATAAGRVQSVSRVVSAAAAGPKAPPPPPPLPAGGFLPPNSTTDHPAASIASARSFSPTGKHVGSAVAAALAQLNQTSSKSRQVSEQVPAGPTALDSSASSRQNPLGFGISSLAVNLDSRAPTAASPVGSDPGLGPNVTAHQESTTAANAPQHQILGIRGYQRATSINYTQPLTGGLLLSPATRLSLGAVGNDAALSSGRPSLSSESDMGSVFSPQGSNKRSSLGAAGNVLNPRLQPPLKVPENVVVPGSRRGSVGGNTSSGLGSGAESERGMRVGNPLVVPGLQLGGVGPSSTVEEAPPLHRRDRQQEQRQQQKLAVGGVAVQARNVFGREGGGTGTISAGRLVSKVLNTGLTDFVGSDSEDADADDDGGGVGSLSGNRANDPGFGNSSSHNTLVTQRAAAAPGGVGGGAMRESGVPKIDIRHDDAVCAGDDEFDF